MSFKTTAALGLVLAALGCLYAVLRQSPAVSKSDTIKPTSLIGAEVSRALIADDFGDAVKITVQNAGSPRWVFEKDTTSDAAAGAASWKMIEPLAAKASGWEVDRIARDLGQLKYEISHKQGQPGSISPADAGLAPPHAAVTLTNASGKSITVEIGQPASRNDTYVRLAGSDEIVLGKSNLKTLLKNDPIEYRDTQVWNFAPENARKVEIALGAAADGEQVYRFVRDGARWMMEAPTTAKATNKVNDALQAISRLRVQKWQEDAKNKLAAYGLDRPALTISVTVEEQVPVNQDESARPPEDLPPAADAKPEPPATETKTTVHVLKVSDISPIGEDTKTFLRVGDETVVGTILKTVADKLKPVMNEWREMRIITADADRAAGVAISVGGESATLTKTGEAWAFDGDTGRAEKAEVDRLLTAIKNLNAAVFLDATEQELSEYGLVHPFAKVSLTIPGVEGTECLSIGGFTDETAKLMRYARRNDLRSMAKVRTSELEPILRPISAYSDRTVLDGDSEDIDRISIQTKDLPGGEPLAAVFAKSDGTWHMTEPVDAAARVDQLTKFVDSLAHLKATAIAPSSHAVELDRPDAALAITRTAQNQTHELRLAAREGRCYAKLADRDTVYELAKDLCDQAVAEYRDGKIMAFEPSRVTRFAIHQGDTAYAFVRKGGGWIYEAEPDLPLTATKVENLLLQIKDLQTQRFVVYAAADLSKYGLSNPARRVLVTTDDLQEHVLLISDLPRQTAAGPGVLSTSGTGAVFLLTEDLVRKVDVKLDDLSNI